MHGRRHAWLTRWCACMAGEKATAADGTYPSGMHSCFIMIFTPEKYFYYQKFKKN